MRKGPRGDFESPYTHNCFPLGIEVKTICDDRGRVEFCTKSVFLKPEFSVLINGLVTAAAEHKTACVSSDSSAYTEQYKIHCSERYLTVKSAACNDDTPYLFCFKRPQMFPNFTETLISQTTIESEEARVLLSRCPKTD